jgi:hypothetical protein
MPRGKRDVERTRRIIRQILQGIPYKQIAFEYRTTKTFVSTLASRYLRREVRLVLNSKGERLMSVEEQLSLKLGDPNA